MLAGSPRVAAEGERGQTQRNAFTAGYEMCIYYIVDFFRGCFTLISVYLVVAIAIVIVAVVLLSAQFRLLKFAALLSVFCCCCCCGRLRCYCFTLDELTVKATAK